MLLSLHPSNSDPVLIVEVLLDLPFLYDSGVGAHNQGRIWNSKKQSKRSRQQVMRGFESNSSQLVTGPPINPRTDNTLQPPSMRRLGTGGGLL